MGQYPLTATSVLPILLSHEDAIPSQTAQSYINGGDCHDWKSVLECRGGKDGWHVQANRSHSVGTVGPLDCGSDLGRVFSPHDLGCTALGGHLSEQADPIHPAVRPG